MSEHTRTPGRVDEEAAPVEGASSPSDGGHLGSEDKAGSVAEKYNESRKPGPVEGPSEAILDEQVGIQSVGIIDPELEKRSPWRFVFLAFSATVIVWLFYGVGAAIVGMWQQHSWFGLPLVLIACVFLVALGIAIWREYRALNAIDSLEDRRVRMRAAIASNNLVNLREILEPTLKNLRQRHPNRIAEFEEATTFRETASDYLKQFENMVLVQLDTEANAVIKRSAFVGGTVVAIVPHPALDAAVALWRAIVLIRKIGEIYGLEPTGLSSLRLLKHSIVTTIIAAGTSVALDLTLEQVTQEVFNQATASIGKGVVEGLVTAGRLYRLGNMTQQLCRPMTS